MAGLVAYASSDEEDSVDEAPQSQPEPSAAAPKVAPQPEPVKAPTPPQDDGALIGPSLPPAEPQTTELPPLEPDTNGGPPLSPYSANRTLLRDLTLPTVPDLDIPPTPPGTPPPGFDALNKKFENFLELKRKKGTHFNARIAQSNALKNPALMDKLLGFVGIESSFEADGSSRKSEPTAQYATTLPPEIWDPAAFPGWASKGALRKSQEKLHKERQRGTGEAMDFVSASGASSKQGSRSGTPGTTSVTGKRKTRFDT
ncbi:uncharacterized protein E0L32_004330 [Thyridium curvatum]|uniref:HCNGP-like protein n=1 Tax=Thyridium curvatum TaxID=1093900 RepID=A0A507B073_9PEZI|nr:uncharacterized protein E0L32_004330 [Thyridium curvatum]TPX15632.1 hypothetical protein E0L32_004330 [Thyridium curvatum]